MLSNTYKSIDEILIDPNFKAVAKNLGIFTLKDLMEIDIRDLKAKSGFTYSWYADLLEILKKENLMDEFQSKLYRP